MARRGCTVYNSPTPCCIRPNSESLQTVNPITVSQPLRQPHGWIVMRTACTTDWQLKKRIDPVRGNQCPYVSMNESLFRYLHLLTIIQAGEPLSTLMKREKFKMRFTSTYYLQYVCSPSWILTCCCRTFFFISVLLFAETYCIPNIQGWVCNPSVPFEYPNTAGGTVLSLYGAVTPLSLLLQFWFFLNRILWP